MRKAKDLMPRQADRLGTVQGHRDGFGICNP
jgi:ribonuclease R